MSRCLVVLALACAAGCAGATSADDASDANQASAQTSSPASSLAKASYVKLSRPGAEPRFIGAPAKIRDLLAAVPVGQELPGLPRCGPPSLALDFVDAEGHSLGTIASMGGSCGYAKLGAKAFSVTFDETKVEAIAARPDAVGDLVWGVTEITGKSTIPGQVAEVEELTGEGARAVVAALSLDEAPRWDAARARCGPPLLSYALRRQDAEIAKIYLYDCGAEETMNAELKVGDKTAPVEMDVGSLIRL